MARTTKTSGRSDMTGTERPASPQLLERTFAILTLFSGKQAEWTTTEISQACGLPLPTVHRIAVALDAHGFLVRDLASRRFRLGPAAIRLGRAALSANALPAVASSLLSQLTADTMETSLLTVPTVGRDGTLCVVRVESPHPLRLSVEPGRLLPLHAGANQKAILAFLPKEDQERILAGPLEKFGRRTISTSDALRAEIETINGCGWAYSLEETDAGVWGVAIALLDEAGHAVAAVGVAGPQVRLSRSVVRGSLEATRRVADEMASSLGLVSSAQGEFVVPAKLEVVST